MTAVLRQSDEIVVGATIVPRANRDKKNRWDGYSFLPDFTLKRIDGEARYGCGQFSRQLAHNPCYRRVLAAIPNLRGE